MKKIRDMGRTFQTCVIRLRGKPDLGYQNLPQKKILYIKYWEKNTTLKSERSDVRLMKCSHWNFPCDNICRFYTMQQYEIQESQVFQLKCIFRTELT